MQKHSHKLIILGIVLFVILGYVVVSQRNQKSSIPLLAQLPQTTIYVQEAELHTYIADTDATRTQGLSGVPKIPIQTGLLFIFPTDGMYTFWMKDMLVPIDILWIDNTGTIIDTTNDFLPSSFPETRTSRVPAQYVLEVNDQFLETYNTKIGEKISFDKKNLKTP